MKPSEKSWKHFTHGKIVDPMGLPSLVATLRQQGKTIATLNGSFDLLHSGHLYIIYEASLLADTLILAVNSDASVKSYKGAQRPFVTLQHRMQLLTALTFVDYVTWFEESDPREILKVIRPDVHVNGAEYGPHCIEADVVREIGAQLHLVDRIPGLATTELVEKIRCG